MKHQFLRMQIAESINENQTIFKVKEKYGFDLLIFSNYLITLIKN